MMGKTWFAVTLCCALLAACGTSEKSKQAADWDFATSTDVLDMSLADLEKRLGKPVTRVGDIRLPSGAVLYQVGECQVSYDFTDLKVRVVRVAIDDKCKPGLRGIPSMKGVDFAKQTRFDALPEGLKGVWSGACIGGPICGEQTKIVSLFVAGNAAAREASVSLNSRLVTKEEVAVASSWAVALIGSSTVYPAKLDQLTICGTADQAQATRLLHGLKIMDVVFGYTAQMAPSGCPKANAPVSPRIAGLTAGGETPAAAPTPAAAAPASFAREKLIGGWAQDRLSCEGDSGVSYDADGTWVSSGDSGTWRIEGDKLIALLTDAGELGEESVKLKTPKRYVTTIVRLDDKLTERTEDGALFTQVRCPIMH